LHAGIITEFGVAYKAEGAAEFDMESFIATAKAEAKQ
jgi:hypothetical protein